MMSDRRNHDTKPTQQTPEGHEIPVPHREDVFRDLEKAAKPRKKRLRVGSSKKKR